MTAGRTIIARIDVVVLLGVSWILYPPALAAHVPQCLGGDENPGLMTQLRRTERDRAVLGTAMTENAIYGDGDYFRCDEQDAELGDETLRQWFERIRGDLRDDEEATYRGGELFINGMTMAYDHWRHRGDLAAVRKMFKANYQGEAFRVNFGNAGCPGPLAEACGKAFANFFALHRGATVGNGAHDQHTIRIVLGSGDAERAFDWLAFLKLAGGLARESVAPILFPPLAVANLFRSLFGNRPGGGPKTVCRARNDADHRRSKAFLALGIDGLLKLREDASRIAAAEAAGQQALAAMNLAPTDLVFDAPATAKLVGNIRPADAALGASDPMVTVDFARSDMSGGDVAWVTATVRRMRPDGRDGDKRYAEGAVVAQRRLRVPLRWVLVALVPPQRNEAIGRIVSECSALGETNTWKFIIDATDGPDWAKLLLTVGGHAQITVDHRERSRDDKGRPGHSRFWMRLSDWQRIARLDALYRPLFAVELARLGRLQPPDALQTWQLAQHLQARLGQRRSVDVFLRDVDFNPDLLLAQTQAWRDLGMAANGGLRDAWERHGAAGTLAFIQANVERGAAASGLDLGGLSQGACTVAALAGLFGAKEFAANPGHRAREACDWAYEDGYGRARPGQRHDLVPLLRMQGFVSFAHELPVQPKRTYVSRLVLPGAVDPRVAAGSGQAPESLFDRMLRKIYFAALGIEPADNVVPHWALQQALPATKPGGDFAKAFARQYAGALPARRHAISMGFREVGAGGETAEFAIDQWFVDAPKVPGGDNVVVGGERWSDAYGEFFRAQADAVVGPAKGPLGLWAAATGVPGAAIAPPPLKIQGGGDMRMYVNERLTRWSMITSRSRPGSRLAATTIVEVCQGGCS